MSATERAYREGVAAQIAKLTVADCPYPAGFDERVEWLRGFEVEIDKPVTEKEALADELAKNGHPAEAEAVLLSDEEIPF